MNWFKRDKSKANTGGSKTSSDFVNVLDFETQTITRMPARELTSDMVEARVHGVEGTVWVDSRDLRQSDYKHPPFSEQTRGVLRAIKASIDEFHPLSVEEWEDGFRRDSNPDKEISIWLHLARIYHRMTSERDLSAAQRREYFLVLVTCLNSPREHVFHVHAPEAISREEAETILEEYYKPFESIPRDQLGF